MKKEKVYNEAVSGDEGFAPGDGYPSCDGEPCANVSDETDEATDTLADGEPAAEADDGPPVGGELRIVEFPGVDICACCGTHVTHTGEIGMVKLLSVEKFREGVRIEMICGKRVLDFLNMVNAQNHQISVKLSAKMDKTAQAVARLQDENFALKGRVHSLEENFIVNEAAKWNDCENPLLFENGMEAGSVQKLADAVLQVCKGRCAVFSRNADGSYKYAMGEKDGDLRQFTKDMNAALNGRGGGKPFFVQGSVQASEKEIRAFFEE